MPTIVLRDDGWFALPAEFRRKLKLKSGDELEVEVVEGDAIRLRPRAKGTAAPQEEASVGAETEVLVEAFIPTPSSEPPPPQPKRRGRPPKIKQET